MRKQELHPRTAVLNKHQKNQSKKTRIDALAWLTAQFPKAFDNSIRINPLKLNIMQDILMYADEAAQAGISKSKLREAVVLFTRRLDYLACLKAREMRIDLNGDLTTEVTEAEAEHAAVKIKKRVEKGVRNARKMLAEKTFHPTSKPSLPNGVAMAKLATSSKSATEDCFPIYPPRAPAFGSQNSAQPAKTVASVVVKHKTTRQYDPDAVARLKEKLGLKRRTETHKETVE